MLAGVTSGLDMSVLQGLPWEFNIMREAFHEWLRMDPNYGRMVLLRLQELGGGWATTAAGTTKCLKGAGLATLELYSTKITKSGRILFEVAEDWSEVTQSWKDMIRIWVREALCHCLTGQSWG